MSAILSINKCWLDVRFYYKHVIWLTLNIGNYKKYSVQFVFLKHSSKMLAKHIYFIVLLKGAQISSCSFVSGEDNVGLRPCLPEGDLHNLRFEHNF